MDVPVLGLYKLQLTMIALAVFAGPAGEAPIRTTVQHYSPVRLSPKASKGYRPFQDRGPGCLLVQSLAFMGDGTGSRKRARPIGPGKIIEY